MIAHRLSTIAKADNIAVLQKGRLMEQGTHEQLLTNEAGVYSGLVRAQQLSLGKETPKEGEESESIDEDKVAIEEENIAHPITSILSRQKSSPGAAEKDGPKLDITAVETAWKTRGLIGSFGRLLYEQRSRIPNYLLIVLFAGIVAAGLPLQAYLFAQVINVFTIPVLSQFVDRAEFWSLMWFVLALGIGIGYLGMAFVAVSLQYYICAVYRQQYFEALIRQRIKFFDSEDNSVGTLAARVQGDPKQLEELLGMNMVSWASPISCL